MLIFHFDAFLVLADTLNYTKAAAILHTTQPNLSKIIVNLENEIGVRLFNRTKRGVSLTAAGEVFRDEARKSADQYRIAIERARQAEAGICGVINVGFLSTALAWLLPSLVKRFKEIHPNIKLNLYDFTYTKLMEALVNRQVELALIPERELANIPNLSKRFLFADAMCLAVNIDNPLAALDIIDLPSVQEEPFIVIDPQVSIRDYEMVTDICMEHDFLPSVMHKANTLNALLLLVECGEGIAILAEHMSRFASKNIKFIPLKGYERFFRVSCVWQANANPCIDPFLHVIDNLEISQPLATTEPIPLQ